MTDYYQKNYRLYHEKTFAVDPSAFLEPLAERLIAGATVLDVGCGSGRDLLWMKNKGFYVIGLDRASGLVKIARQNTGCEVIEGDFATYDFSVISADAIMLIGALVHVPHDRFSDIFKNIIQSLTDFGKILITLKEGIGARTDEVGRIFYLWQDQKARVLFDSHGYRVCDFSRSSSKTGSGEIWLGYVLGKKAPPAH
ncbi:MAG: methyltransferase domain-containing protein [Thermodesulfobacteriota bacterium]|nr:methyltransferase domain-containing protein [Thermodesulfobacteriota bacterium]